MDWRVNSQHKWAKWNIGGGAQDWYTKTPGRLRCVPEFSLGQAILVVASASVSKRFLGHFRKLRIGWRNCRRFSGSRALVNTCSYGLIRGNSAVHVFPIQRQAWKAFFVEIVPQASKPAQCIESLEESVKPRRQIGNLKFRRDGIIVRLRITCFVAQLRIVCVWELRRPANFPLAEAKFQREEVGPPLLALFSYQLWRAVISIESNLTYRNVSFMFCPVESAPEIDNIWVSGGVIGAAYLCSWFAVVNTSHSIHEAIGRNLSECRGYVSYSRKLQQKSSPRAWNLIYAG